MILSRFVEVGDRSYWIAGFDRVGGPGARHVEVSRDRVRCLSDLRSAPYRSAAARPSSPGGAVSSSETWRTRQFEYTWLRTAADRYADFERVTTELLAFAADASKLDLTAEQRESAAAGSFRAQDLARCDPGADKVERCRSPPRPPFELHARDAQKLHQVCRILTECSTAC